MLQRENEPSHSITIASYGNNVHDDDECSKAADVVGGYWINDIQNINIYIVIHNIKNVYI